LLQGGAISCAIQEVVLRSNASLDKKNIRYIAIDYLSPCRGEVILSVCDKGSSINTNNNNDNNISSSLSILIHNNINATSINKKKTSIKNKLRTLAQATVLMME
jgi:hypothetical protein